MRRPVNRGHRAAVVSLPAPVGGWNSNVALDAMAATDAIELINFYPEADAVRTRAGVLNRITGYGTTVKTLAEWRGPADMTLIAAANGNLYDTDPASASSSSLASGLGSDDWQYVNFNGYLVLCNGVDAVRTWEGTTLAAPGYTGVSPSVLIQVEAYKSRLYFVEVGKAKFWYGAVGAVTGGALTAFDIGQIARSGGYLMAVGSWSQDSGDGKDDLFVAVMSTGEVLIYQGDDPGSTFALVGRYQGVPPIGRRCLARVGGKLVILTQTGVLPVEALLQGGTITSLQNDPVWGKSRKAISDAFATYGSSSAGWQLFAAQSRPELIVNVPVVTGAYEQIVLNTTTGAWCKYTGINAYCWGAYNDKLYVGMATTLAEHTGTDDNGTDISAVARNSFQYVGGRGPKKRITQVRPVVVLEGDVTATLGVNTDFGTRSFPVGNITLRGPSTDGAAWDAEDWDAAEWAEAATAAAYRWYSAGGVGNNFSIYLAVNTNRALRWYSTDLLGQAGANW